MPSMTKITPKRSDAVRMSASAAERMAGLQTRLSSAI